MNLMPIWKVFHEAGKVLRSIALAAQFPCAEAPAISVYIAKIMLVCNRAHSLHVIPWMACCDRVATWWKHSTIRTFRAHLSLYCCSMVWIKSNKQIAHSRHKIKPHLRKQVPPCKLRFEISHCSTVKTTVEHNKQWEYHLWCFHICRTFNNQCYSTVQIPQVNREP